MIPQICLKSSLLQQIPSAIHPLITHYTTQRLNPTQSNPIQFAAISAIAIAITTASISTRIRCTAPSAHSSTTSVRISRSATAIPPLDIVRRFADIVGLMFENGNAYSCGGVEG
ncbi:hypothetical protein ABVK25_000617 [Lepraria finkii]|uniref:Uncharacterized protein n=1 Tax=Lepraria finkii TaxID=1340010 RepID=A0ABR4BNM8_9LECA